MVDFLVYFGDAGCIWCEGILRFNNCHDVRRVLEENTKLQEELWRNHWSNF